MRAEVAPGFGNLLRTWQLSPPPHYLGATPHAEPFKASTILSKPLREILPLLPSQREIMHNDYHDAAALMFLRVERLSSSPLSPGAGRTWEVCYKATSPWCLM